MKNKLIAKSLLGIAVIGMTAQHLHQLLMRAKDTVQEKRNQ